MNKLKKFITGLFILFLFTGCRTGMPTEIPEKDFQTIESAFLEGNWDELINYSKKLLEREPGNAVVRFVLSMAYYMKGEYDLQEEQRSLVLEDVNNLDAIITWSQNLANRFSNNCYAHLLLGSAYRAKGEVNKALGSYQRAIEINPNFADAYLGLGLTYLASEQVEEAIKSLKKAIETNPAHMAAHFSLGLTYEYNNQIDEAIASYEKTVEISPHFIGAYMYLGDLYSEKGDMEKAIKAYEKVIELDPGGELGMYAKEAIERAQEHPDAEKAP